MFALETLLEYCHWITANGALKRTVRTVGRKWVNVTGAEDTTPSTRVRVPVKWAALKRFRGEINVSLAARDTRP